MQVIVGADIPPRSLGTEMWCSLSEAHRDGPLLLGLLLLTGGNSGFRQRMGTKLVGQRVDRGLPLLAAQKGGRNVHPCCIVRVMAGGPPLHLIRYCGSLIKSHPLHLVSSCKFRTKTMLLLSCAIFSQKISVENGKTGNLIQCKEHVQLT